MNKITFFTLTWQDISTFCGKVSYKDGTSLLLKRPMFTSISYEELQELMADCRFAAKYPSAKDLPPDMFKLLDIWSDVTQQESGIPRLPQDVDPEVWDRPIARFH